MKIFRLIILLIFSTILFGACSIDSNETIPPQRSQDIVTFTAKYHSWACGENTPRILPVSEIYPKMSNKLLEYGFVFYVPENLKAPDTIETIEVQDNLFELSGYFYYTEEDGQKFLHPRFDLVNWKALKPFHIWSAKGEMVEVSSSSFFNLQFGTNSQPNNFSIARKYDLCE